jgi:hypothetical protein
MIENNRPTELIEVYVEDAEWIRKLAAACRKSDADVVEQFVDRLNRFAYLPESPVVLSAFL